MKNWFDSDNQSLTTAQKHIKSVMGLVRDNATEVLKSGDKQRIETLRVEIAAMQGVHPSEVKFEVEP